MDSFGKFEFKTEARCAGGHITFSCGGNDGDSTTYYIDLDGGQFPETRIILGGKESPKDDEKSWQFTGTRLKIVGNFEFIDLVNAFQKFIEKHPDCLYDDTRYEMCEETDTSADVF